MATEKTDKKISKPAPKAAVKKTVAPKKAEEEAVKKPAVKKVSAPVKPKPEVFAVIQTGGKQYLVSPEETLKIEKIERPEKGDTVIFEEILLVFDGKEVKIGTPYVKGAKVTAKIEEDERDKKINVIRYKSKTRQFKKKGHRQIRTKITITEIK